MLSASLNKTFLSISFREEEECCSPGASLDSEDRQRVPDRVCPHAERPTGQTGRATDSRCLPPTALLLHTRR